MTRDHMLWSAHHQAARGHAQVGGTWPRFPGKLMHELVCRFGWEKNPHISDMAPGMPHVARPSRRDPGNHASPHALDAPSPAVAVHAAAVKIPIPHRISRSAHVVSSRDSQSFRNSSYSTRQRTSVQVQTSDRQWMGTGLRLPIEVPCSTIP